MRSCNPETIKCGLTPSNCGWFEDGFCYKGEPKRATPPREKIVGAVDSKGKDVGSKPPDR